MTVYYRVRIVRIVRIRTRGNRETHEHYRCVDGVRAHAIDGARDRCPEPRGPPPP